VCCDCFTQKVVAFRRPVSAERVAVAELVRCRFQGAAAGFRQGFGHVADSQLDDRSAGIGSLKGFHAAGDFGEEIRALQLQVVWIDLGHGRKGYGSGLVLVLKGNRNLVARGNVILFSIQSHANH